DVLNKVAGLPSNLIRAIYEDEEGIFWLASEDLGLIRLELQGASLHEAAITSYTRKHGLFDDVLHAILEDGDGRFWISSNRGIFWVERATLERFAAGAIEAIHTTGYDTRNGMRNREANGGTQPSAARDAR